MSDDGWALTRLVLVLSHIEKEEKKLNELKFRKNELLKTIDTLNRMDVNKKISRTVDDAEIEITRADYKQFPNEILLKLKREEKAYKKAIEPMEREYKSIANEIKNAAFEAGEYTVEPRYRVKVTKK